MKEGFPFRAGACLQAGLSPMNSGPPRASLQGGFKRPRTGLPDWTRPTTSAPSRCSAWLDLFSTCCTITRGFEISWVAWGSPAPKGTCLPDRADDKGLPDASRRHLLGSQEAIGLLRLQR